MLVFPADPLWFFFFLLSFGWYFYVKGYLQNIGIGDQIGDYHVPLVKQNAMPPTVHAAAKWLIIDI